MSLCGLPTVLVGCFAWCVNRSPCNSKFSFRPAGLREPGRFILFVLEEIWMKNAKKHMGHLSIVIYYPTQRNTWNGSDRAVALARWRPARTRPDHVTAHPIRSGQRSPEGGRPAGGECESPGRGLCADRTGCTMPPGALRLWGPCSGNLLRNRGRQGQAVKRVSGETAR